VEKPVYVDKYVDDEAEVTLNSKNEKLQRDL